MMKEKNMMYMLNCIYFFLQNKHKKDYKNIFLKYMWSKSEEKIEIMIFNKLTFSFEMTTFYIINISDRTKHDMITTYTHARRRLES